VADPFSVTPAQASLYGSIMLSARLHATTAEVWQGIREAAAATGQAIPAGMFDAVNLMRSRAVGVVRGSEALAGAAPGDAITGSMIGQQLYARGAAAMALSPAYHVRFEVAVTAGGQTRTGWYNLEYTGNLPATVGGLMSDISAYATGLGDTYGSAMGGIGTVQIGAF
jgi:hypothetical protein